MENNVKQKAMTVRLDDDLHKDTMKYLIDKDMSFNQYVKLLLGVDRKLEELIEMIESDLDLTKDIEVYNKKVGNIVSHNQYLKNLIKDIKEILILEQEGM